MPDLAFFPLIPAIPLPPLPLPLRTPHFTCQIPPARGGDGGNVASFGKIGKWEMHWRGAHSLVQHRPRGSVVVDRAMAISIPVPTVDRNDRRRRFMPGIDHAGIKLVRFTFLRFRDWMRGTYCRHSVCSCLFSSGTREIDKT